MILDETVISSLVPEHTAILELIPCFSDEWGRKRKNGVMGFTFQRVVYSLNWRLERVVLIE